jgi:putative membrane protein
MKLIIKLITTAVIVLLISYFWSSVHVDSFKTSIVVAVVLGLLNVFVKPILQFFSFPVTILTLGLFLLVINAIIIVICERLVDGFRVDGFLNAIIFSIVLSVCQSIANYFINDK